MSDIVSRGLDLAMYGMGTVFVFLTLLVLLTMFMSAIVKTSPVPASGATTEQADGTIDPTTLAVITAAVRQYRQKHRA